MTLQAINHTSQLVPYPNTNNLTQYIDRGTEQITCVVGSGGGVGSRYPCYVSATGHIFSKVAENTEHYFP